MSTDFDYRINILLIGNATVGKTSLLLRYTDSPMNTSYLPTIGVEYSLKTIEHQGTRFRLQIWDLSGQERFRAITYTYYRGAGGILLVYSCDDFESFESILHWFEKIHQHAPENVPMVLIGNKSDSENRKISWEQGNSLANKLRIPFFETSAKFDLNISKPSQPV
jgi:small GTP-binding protein